jgi:hypothetical protein
MILSNDTMVRPAIVDLSYLEASSFGKSEFVLHAIDILLEQLPAHVQDLNDACMVGDWPQLKLAAHKIKAAAALLCMEPVKTKLAEIEASGHTPANVDDFRHRVREISGVCSLAVEELRVERYKYL